jgi:CheY-like chemotaxis protein
MTHPNPREPASKATGPRDGRPNSLGLDAKKLDSLLARVDGRNGSAARRRRKYVRWAFRKITVELQINHPGGSAITCRVACRNLSCGGIGVVHSAFLYPGSTCVVTLPRQGGRPLAASGVILRCVHVQDMVHEIGIKFDREIDVGEFMDRDPLARRFSLEAIEAADLVGIVLHIEHSPLEQQLIRHYLRGSGLRLRPAHRPEQAAAIARDGCDVVLCNLMLPDPGAAAALAAVRAVSSGIPAVVLAADSSPATLERVRALAVDAFLAKPFDDAILLRAIGEFLLVRRKEAAEAADDAEVPGRDWASTVAKFPDELEAAVRDNDAGRCYVVCEQIITTARAMRLPALERLARKASDSLSTTMNLAKSEQPVRELITACGRRAA